MTKKKSIFLLITLTTLLLGATTAYAKTAIDACPVVTNASALDKKYLTPYEIHQGNPSHITGYTCWVSTDGGMYWLHETWTCSLCGNFIAKDSFMGSITDTLSENEELRAE